MTSVQFSFGSFDGPCAAAALVTCPLLGKDGVGFAPTCFARNFEYQATHFLLFQPASLVLRFLILIIAVVMVVHVKCKYTAVGRTEFATFLYVFILSTLFEALLDSNLIPMASSSYKYVAAISNGLSISTFWCLFVNGLVPFQWLDEGSAASLWFVRISVTLVAVLSSLITYATFQSALFFSKTNPVFLFIITFILPMLGAALYIAIQVYLVLNRLSTYWPLGDLALATIFFVLGQTVTFFLSGTICETTKHYIDGNFFGMLCLGLSVMMIYKYWDTVTEDEDEVGVVGRPDDWKVADEANYAWNIMPAEKQPLYQPYHPQQRPMVPPIGHSAVMTRVPPFHD